MKRLLNLLVAGVIVASSMVGVMPIQNTAHAAPDTTILSEGFENGSSNWTTTGNIALDTSIKHAGTQSLTVNGSGNAYNKISSLIINSPNRDLTFYIYPNYSFNGTDSTAWYNASWTQRKKLTFNMLNISENLTDYPVVVKFDATWWDFSAANTTGKDLRFTDSDGTTLLPYELESYNGTESKGWAFVKVPSVQANSDYTDGIYVYFGNTSAADAQTPTSVWNSNYSMVQHMYDNPTNNKISSSTNTNNGTKVAANAPLQTNGLIGNAQSFNATPDYFSVTGFSPDFSATSNFSQEAWVNTSNISGEHHIAEWGNTQWYTFGTAAYYVETGGISLSANSQFTSTGSWKHFAVTRNGSTGQAIMYIQGEQVASITGVLSNPSTNLDIGRNRGNADTTLMWMGLIDELKITSNVLTAGWIKADYLSGNNTFIRYPVASPTYSSIISLEEAAFVSGSRQIPLAISWNGTHVYADLKQYDVDTTPTGNATSSIYAISNNAWHEIHITTNTSSTEIELDGVPMQFAGVNTSTNLTNVYNWVKFKAPEFNASYNVDDIVLQKETIDSEVDLFGRVFDQIDLSTIPSGLDAIQAVYPLILTDNTSYLAIASNAADLIETSYNAGNKNLPYVKEMAILSYYQPSRLPLVTNLASLLWTYKVDPTTKLPYRTIDNVTGAYIDQQTWIGGYDVDAIDTVSAFVFAGEATGNSTFTSEAELILSAINTYMLIPTYGTIATAANATTGTQTQPISRVDDEVSNYIEATLATSNLSGNSTLRAMAINQANKYTQFAWDNTNQIYQYRPNNPDFEAYTPTISAALIHAFQASGNTTYRTNAIANYFNFMTQMRRNGLIPHSFSYNGVHAGEPGYLSNHVFRSGALVSKYSGNTTATNISNQYASIVESYYLTPNMEGIYDNSFVNYVALPYLERLATISNILYGFVSPSSGVSINWSFGKLDMYGKMRGMFTAPLDVSFTRNSVTLDDISGSGTVNLIDGIQYVYLTQSPYDGAQFTVPANHEFPYPPTLPSVTTGAVTHSGSTATLNGNITNMGVASSTYAYFQWYQDGAIHTTALQTKNAISSVTQSITYDPNKNLTFRIVSQVGSVTTNGSWVTLNQIQGNSLFKTVIPIIFALVVGIVILSVALSVGITIQILAIAAVGGALAYYIVASVVNLLF